MERRNFIGNLAKGAGTIMVLPTLITACEADPELLLIDLTDAQNSALLNAGGYVVRDNVIIINDGGKYIALSSVCTHAGCEVSYDASSNNIPCACHGSRFSTSGSVLNGPADAPLASYPVTENGDVLEIEMG